MAAYSPQLFCHLVGGDNTAKRVVFIVCGGFKVSMKEMEEYQIFVQKELKEKETWIVEVDGESLELQRSPEE